MFVNFWKTVSFLLVLENVARLTRGVGNDNNLHQFSLNFAGQGLFLSDKKPRVRAQEGRKCKEDKTLAKHTWDFGSHSTPNEQEKIPGLFGGPTHPLNIFFLFWTCPFISAMFVSFCRAMFSDLKWIRIWYQMYQIFDRTCQKNFKIDSQTCSCLFLIRTFFPAQVYFLWRRVRQTFALRK